MLHDLIDYLVCNGQHALLSRTITFVGLIFLTVFNLFCFQLSSVISSVVSMDAVACDAPKSKKFKFKTFSERLKEINIDAIHRIRDVNSTKESEDSSKIFECVHKWKNLDKTAHFKAFFHEIGPKIRTYKMVVHYQDHIVESLKYHLSVEDTLALQSLLEVLVSLSADLGPDFYPKFFVVFPILTSLLKTRDADKLEWIFVSISLLFRNLWRYMIHDMNNVLDLYRTLLVSSQPSHIASFAAESVSFLLRKTPDHKAVLEKLFCMLECHPKAANAVGQVLFHMLKTSQSQFHSKTTIVLPDLLYFVSKSYCDMPYYESACLCIENTIKLMADHTKRKYAAPVWNIIMNEVKRATNEVKDPIYCNNLIKFLNTWCEAQHGAKLANCFEFINAFKLCCLFVGNYQSTDEVQSLYSSLCVLATTVVVGSKVELEDRDKKNIVKLLVKKVMSFDSIAALWQAVIARSDFLILYLNAFLEFCAIQIQHETNRFAVIKLIASFVVANQSLPQDSDDLRQFNPRCLDFTSLSDEKNRFEPGNIIRNVINEEKDFSSVWYSLVALFSVKPLHVSLKTSVMKIITKLMQNDSYANEELAVICMACCVAMKLYGSEIFSAINCRQFVLLLVKRHSSRHLLLIFDVVASSSAAFLGNITNEDMDMLVNSFEKNLSLPDAVLRRLSLKALRCIDKTNSNWYEICLNGEDTPATVQNYREKVMILTKLQNIKNEVSDQCKSIVIRYLFSNLFINFTSLWKPVQDILCHFAVANPRDVFWMILFELLEGADTQILKYQNNDNYFESTFGDNALFNAVVNGHVKPKHYVCNERIDYVNFRLLLWKTLVSLPYVDALKKHAGVLGGLFLNFIKVEFFQVDKQLALYEEIKTEDQGTCPKIHAKKSSCNELLMTMFKVYCRFSNLKNLLHSDSLQRLFTDFLCHSESNYQMASFQCILLFHDNIIQQNKETLMSFIDEKKFRHAVVNFDIKLLSSDERRVVLPVLLQILLGKLKSNEKMSVGGKATPDARRSLIVRFLSQISSEEMNMFSDMLCRPYIRYLESVGLSSSFNHVETKICNTIKIMPVKRQSGILHCIHLLVMECNLSISNDTFATLLKMVLQMNAINKAAMDRYRSNPKNIPKVLYSLRNIKRQSLECLFDLLNAYPSSLDSSLADALFNLHVWPELSNLCNECTGKPSLFLKMLRMFAERPSYMPLLVKVKSVTPHNSNENITPLSTISKLLLLPKCSADVASYVIDLLLCLLYDDMEENFEDSQLSVDPIDFVKEISNALSVSGTLAVQVKPKQIESRYQFGLLLVMPHLDKVLSYFIHKLRNKRKGFLLPDRCLHFLSSVGEIVTDEALLANLSELLLGHISSAISKSHSNKDQSFSLSLKSLSCVMRNTTHIDQVARLFSKLSERTHRTALVSILSNACRSESAYSWTCNVVSQLNAWDKNSVLDIDYDARFSGFRKVLNRLKTDDYEMIFDLNCNLFLPILHSCLHMMSACSSDISIKDSVLQVFEMTMQRICDMFSLDFDHAYSVYQKIIQQLLLPSVQRGLNSSVEDIRHDYIKLLSKLVEFFPNDPELIGLNTLKTDNPDEEDVFDNLRHIQMHRRARGFRKVAALLQKQYLAETDSLEAESQSDQQIAKKPSTSKAISPTTASKYLLPLAFQCLLNQKFKDIEYVRDACIDVVKCCARMIPWSLYKKMLIRSMTDMKHHTTSFHIICGLLGVFPYDLSRYKLTKSRTLVGEETIADEFVDNAIDENVNLKSADQSEVLRKNKLTLSDVEVIVNDVTRVILPSLCALISVEDKKNPKRSNPEITYRLCERKLPYVKPTVLLLKKLPDSVLRSSLPAVLLNVFAFLKHKDHRVRAAAENATVNALELLGPQYFSLIIKQLNASMSRGFHRHVFVYLVHLMLTSLVSEAKVGVFDDVLDLLLDIACSTLFAKVKKNECGQPQQKLPEAKGQNKAYSIYHNITKFVRRSDVTTVIQPFAHKLYETQDHSDINVINKVLKEIEMGLLCNDDMQAKDILVFIHGIISENISSLFSEKKAPSVKKNTPFQSESCLILPKAPKRYGEQPIAKNKSTNIHLLVEFALGLLHAALKKNTIDLINHEHLEMLDPLITNLSRCLASIHIKTIAGTIKCLTRLYRAGLPSLSTNAKSIIERLFEIARENSKGMGNRLLSAASFKSLSVICCTEYGKQFTTTQLQTLLAYAEEDIHDVRRQNYSFDLIKSIIKRGLQCNEMIEIMDNVRNIAIQSLSEVSQSRARSLYVYFLKNYPMPAPKIEEHLQFILGHLNFEYEVGRMSALQLLSSIATNFPETVLIENAGMIFVPTAAVMINDEAAKCRKAAAGVVKFLLSRLKQEVIDELFFFAMQW